LFNTWKIKEMPSRELIWTAGIISQLTVLIPQTPSKGDGFRAQTLTN